MKKTFIVFGSKSFKAATPGNVVQVSNAEASGANRHKTDASGY